VLDCFIDATMENKAMSDYPTYSATDIANAFIELARRDGRTLSNMQLQKLVYIAFGYFAGFMKDKLFRDEIQAWEYGPVIPNLYHRLKQYGVGPVTVIPAEWPSNRLAGPEMQVVEGVWDAYRKYSALELSDLTHKDGTPWSKMREKLQGRQNIPIPFSLIQEHYEQIISDRMKENG
jgi:uncharacterized phage-associated protein